MAHVVTQPCCNDASCVAVCPVDCIHPTPQERVTIRTEMLFIDPDTCIDCGACIDECPVDAIVPPEDITSATQPFVEMNAAYFRDRPRVTSTDEKAPPVGTSSPGTLRVAIVGSGPSACYVADALCTTKGLDVEVTILEKLPTPGGLVRYGVAPDHAATKGIAKLFARTLGRKSCTVHLNTEVGVHVTHDELLRHHHAVVYASGAEGDRRLGIPGEHLPGTVAARDFVLWYNGHPDHADAKFDLTGECAVVVGNGNVALDVARILTSDASRLIGTDIAEHALEALVASRIRKVVVLGRRGPEHAAFSTPELLGLGNLPGLDVTASHPFDPALAADELTRIRASILDRYHHARPVPGNRQIHLQFFRSPTEVLGATVTDGLRVEVTGPALGGDPEVEDLTAGLVLRSVGFRGRPLPGVPFDDVLGVLPNRNGVVHDPATGTPVRGVYTAGWLKRGPIGVIGSNRLCSEQTVAELVSDFAAGRLGSVEEELSAFRRLLAQRHADRVDLAGWKRLDAHERKAGRVAGRPRVKVVNRLGMVDVALQRRVPETV
ncbi:FAD-dependent oxidoreductase [Rhodococcus sp. NPDC003318]|uniref:FAD-dependent oxidoreductase n=1 Tax=Rhodococcus sp. NPDC003318 TaxID=3364503 RepID=UPI0036A416E5